MIFAVSGIAQLREAEGKQQARLWWPLLAFCHSANGAKTVEKQGVWQCLAAPVTAAALRARQHNHLPDP
jgi:hypothetical protein